MSESISIILFLAAILVMAAILFAVISLTKRAPARLDVSRYQTSWMAIENGMKKDESSTYHMSILNADSLLDKALKETGISGATMGERMKYMQKKWSNANNVWAAHKLRNKIAHESDVSIDYDSARRTLMSFKQALKDVGAI